MKDVDPDSLVRTSSLAKVAPGAHIHLCGICGTGMAAVAELLKQQGYYISGSDKAFYPPMGEIVKRFADVLYSGYSAENLKKRPDFVIFGNSISANNPEAEFIQKEKIPFASMPEVFAAILIGDREHCPISVVISGTHGKTTTTAMVATIFEVAGLKPGFFIGGKPNNFTSGIRALDLSVTKNKRVVVLEGDEYDSAYFAKWPKFHSYRPDILVITSVEFDHADIYQSLEEIEAEFSKLVRRVPKTGHILVWDGSERLAALAKSWAESPDVQAKIDYYGENSDSSYHLIERVVKGEFQELTVSLAGLAVNLLSNTSGIQNVYNILAASAVAKLCDVDVSKIASGVKEFKGVQRRQNSTMTTKGVLVIEDFAHHPTAVKLTLEGLKESHPDKRLIVAFEPRSNTSRRDFFQIEYVNSFDVADIVIIQEPTVGSGYSAVADRVVPLNVVKLVEDIKSKKHKQAKSVTSTGQIVQFLNTEASKGDVVVIMSNGDFGGLKDLIISQLNQE
jgi:UDP-N-acetylmuramate: L-alanyl-gamma-D-glutamyl-meso-diaminopimelate ligase